MSGFFLPSIYLSADSPLGYLSRLKELCQEEGVKRAFLLKGGMKNQKSEIIAGVIDAFDQNDGEVCRILRCENPSLLEGAIFPNAVIVDADAPHPIEPRLPGIVEEIVWLGDCFDNALLSNAKRKIADAAERETALADTALKFLNAACQLLSDNRRVVRCCSDTDKLDRQAERIAAQMFSGDGFSEQNVLLSRSLSQQGMLYGQSRAENTILLEDDYAVAAPLLLERLYIKARERGCRVICGFSPLSPFKRLEQLFLPDLSLAFLTADKRLPTLYEPQRIINSRRFIDKKGLAPYKNRMTFNRRAARQMTERSAELMELSRQASQEYERIYQDALLPERLFEIKCELAGKITAV